MNDYGENQGKTTPTGHESGQEKQDLIHDTDTE